MRRSIVLLASCAIAVQSTAQRPASPDQLDKAVDVLRRTPSVPPSPVAQPGVHLKITSSTSAAPAVAPGNSGTNTELSGAAEERARELLRKLMADQKPAASATPAAVTKNPTAPVVVATPAPQPVTSNTAPAELSGAAEERARELLRTITVNQQPAPAVPATTAPAKPAPAAVPASAPEPAPAQVVETPPAQTPPVALADDPLTRARNREAARQKALSDARKLAEQKRATERPAPAITGDQERKALADAERQRELQRIEMEVEKARREREARTTSQVANPSPATAAPAAPAAPLASTAPVEPKTPAAPTQSTTTSPARFPGLTSDAEQRARDVLNQVLANTENAKLPTLANPGSKPAPVPSPAITAAPQPATVTPAPSPLAATPPPLASTPNSLTQPASSELPRDKEAEARRLLEQTLSSLPVQEQKPSQAEAAKPARSYVMPPVATTAAPTKIPAAPAAELPGDKELQARQLLEKTLTNLTVPEDPKTKAEAEKQAKEQAKRELRAKADAEARARREVEKLEDESRSRAREQARKRIADGQAETVAAVPQAATAPQVQTAVAKTAPLKVQRAVATTPVPVEKPSKKNGKSNAAKVPFADNPNATKEQRLADLLSAYQKDEISADQYHTLRRKIITE